MILVHRDVKGVVSSDLVSSYNSNKGGHLNAGLHATPHKSTYKEDVLIATLREAGMLHLLNNDSATSSSSAAAMAVESDSFRVSTASKMPYFDVSTAVDMQVEEQEERCGLGHQGMKDLPTRMRLSRQQPAVGHTKLQL